MSIQAYWLGQLLTATSCRRKAWLLAREEGADTSGQTLYGLQQQQLIEHYERQMPLVLRCEAPDTPGRVAATGALMQRVLSDAELRCSESGVVLKEPVFQCGNVLFSPDFMVLKNGRWHLKLVRAATGIKPRYLLLACCMLILLERSSIMIESVAILCVNRRSRAPFDDLLQELFPNEEIKALRPQANSLLESLMAALESATLPDAHLGMHCLKPHACRYREQCWAAVPALNVFTIPHLAPDRKQQLMQQGWLHLDDVPADNVLTKEQQRYIQLVKSRATQVDYAAIGRSFDTLQYPLYFLDFEADSMPRPLCSDLGPFAKLPFQFSCHRLTENGVESHHGYLHDTASDPRPGIIAGLLAFVGSVGSVVVWHADFERSRLHELAEYDPLNREALTSISRRVWDLELIFKHAYADYRFRGSTSLKTVSQVLSGRDAYGALALNDGEQAVLRWHELLRAKDGRRASIITELEAYCTQDTSALMTIFLSLRSMLAHHHASNLEGSPP